MVNNLIGIWETDPNDIVTQHYYGNVIMEFRNNGELIYTVAEGDKVQNIFMTYTVKGNHLTTDQLSLPKKIVTEFILSEHNLELNFGGIKSKYIRIGSVSD